MIQSVQGLPVLFAGLLLAGAASAAPPSKTPVPAATPAPAQAPCAAPEYRQFDFWLGDWDISSPDGKPAGSNKIVSILNGCAIQENWTGAKGAHGTSLNLYDSATRRWHQTWVDDSGGLLVLDGEFRDGNMVLAGRRPSQKTRGTVLTHRITWTSLPGERVRQLWEASPNDGRTWQTVFDGTYTKRK